MSDKPIEDRVFSVVEFLANQEQIGSKTVKVQGPIIGQSESNCLIGSWGQGIRFDSGDLPESDRIKLLEIGPNGKQPPQIAVVTLNCANSRATHIEFE